MSLRTSHLASHTPSPAKIGRAAEMIVEAKCLWNGLACYTPVTNDGRVDLLVGPQTYRCQIKVLGQLSPDDDQRYLPLVKCGGRAGARVRFRYTPQDVDFMIGVNVDSMDVYVVPIALVAEWTRCISEPELERLGTRDAYHLLVAAPGEVTLPLKPQPVVGRHLSPRQRPSRAWIDTDSLSLGLSFDDNEEECQRV